MLSAPLRGRFGATYRLDYYTPDLLEGEIPGAGSPGVGDRSRSRWRAGDSLSGQGHAAVALRLLRPARTSPRCGPMAACRPVAAQALALMEVDELGLDQTDRRVLETITIKFGGGPVGLQTIAASISEKPDTTSHAIEPYSAPQPGFIDRTPRGNGDRSRLPPSGLDVPASLAPASPSSPGASSMSTSDDPRPPG